MKEKRESDEMRGLLVLMCGSFCAFGFESGGEMERVRGFI